MPSLVKLLFVGDSGTGKTGSLTSLVKAGYKLRILDLDNGLDILNKFVIHECPDKKSNIQAETHRDAYKITELGPMVSGTPRGFITNLKLLSKWSDGSDPADWGPEFIMVIDTLGSLGDTAFNWAQAMNPSAKDPRNWYKMAQDALEKAIDMMTSASFKTNVIVISHIDYKERENGTTKGYARTIGSAIGPIIPKYFNNLILCESTGTGKNTRRMVKTLPTGIVDVKTSAPFRLDKDLPIETALVDIFAKLKED